MKINAQVSISRLSNDEIEISIRDDDAVVKFCTIRMTAGDFAMCITGLAFVKGKGEVESLDKVGKTRVVERRQVECPLDTYDKNILSKWLEGNCQEEGWILDPYLGSQTSVSRKDNKTILNYSVKAWH